MRQGGSSSRVRRLAAVLLLAGIFFSLTPSIRAQAVRDRSRTFSQREALLSEIERARIHLGPFYLLSKLQVGDIGYDEDLLMPSSKENRDIAIAFGVPTKAFLVPSKKFVFAGEIDPTYLWYAHEEENRDWYMRYRGDAHLLLNHLYLDLYAQKSDDLTHDGTEMMQVAQRRLSEIGTKGQFRFSSRTDATFSASRNEIEYPASADPALESIGLLDRNESTVSAAFRHKTFPLTSLYFGGDRSNFDFLHSERNSERTTAYAGFTRKHSTTTLDGKLGLAELQFDDPQWDDYSGAVGTLTLITGMGRRSSATLSVMRELEFSTYEKNAYYVVDQAVFGIAVPMGKQLTVDSRLQIEDNAYPAESQRPDGSSEKRLDRLYQASVGTMFYFNSRFGAGLGIGYYDRTSNFDELSSNGIQLLVRLSIRP